MRGVDAEVGIAVVREGRVIASVGGDRPMPAMSTFKFPLALAVATRLDSLGLPLSTQLEVTGDDLWPDTWSPLREEHPAGGRFSFGELLRYTVAESDNCACDRLIREIGGIGALQRYVEGLPAEGLDFRMTEREMSGYAICVYVAETALSDGETAALIAEISRLVWQRLSVE